MNPRIAWRTLIASALLMAGCGTADVPPQGTGTSGAGDHPGFVSQGVAVTEPVPSAVVFAASASAAARVGPLTAAPGAPSTGPREIPRLRGPRPVELPSPFDPIPAAGVDASGSPRHAAGPATLAADGPAPRAPALLQTFAGLFDDQTVIPPDTMGAAGPDHLVSFLNSEVGFFSKATGVRQNPGVSLLDFWSPLISANGLPSLVFDPKVIYDASSGRFIAVTLDGRLPADNSWILLAVSQSSDPTTGWNTWALPADNTGGTWADYPGIGVDGNNVYLTANLFDGSTPNGFHGSKIWLIPKPQLLTLPQATTLTRTEFTHELGVLQPAHTFGPAPAEYIVTESGFIIGNQRDLVVLAIAGTPPTLSTLGTIRVSPYPNIQGDLPSAPQTQIHTGDTRILNAVYRNGSLYATHTVSNVANTKTEVAWYEINPTSPPTLVQQGRVSDPTRFYYYPSIAVNANGDIALGFSGSSPTEFAGGYYTARLNSDPPGVTQPVSLLKAGEAPYTKTASSGLVRWGDFSATVVDPDDDLTFWTLQEYAWTANRWGTWWGSFRIADIPGPDNVVATLLGSLTVRLTWNDRAASEIGYVVERRAGAGGTFAVLTDPQLPPNSTSYTDNSALALGTTYFYRVGAVSPTSTAYSAEVPVVTQAPRPPGGGGGGGCLSITRAEGPTDGASLLSFGALLLPAAALGLRRVSLRFARTRAFRHPAC